MNEKELFTFWKFLKKNIIEIPIIQRDYAQGRIGKEHLREKFLSNIKNALDGNLPNGEKVLKLDYVYGSMEGNILHPLDGQQRLTTLWLIHWYIGYRAGALGDKLNPESGETAMDRLKRFTYETRISSRRFCEKLVTFNVPQPEGVGIVEHIKSQTWFYSVWMQDPTIQSMLRTLGGTDDVENGYKINDGIEKLFAGVKQNEFLKYWDCLKEETPIIFYFLPLENFDLSDDLYVKMNARGKQLTPFENFKADLINYMRREEEKEEKIGGEWSLLLDPRNGISIKMDTVWLGGIFWQEKSNNKVDEIYYAFINRFFWNELFTAKDGTGEYILKKIGEGLTADGKKTNNLENENISYRHLNKDKDYDEYNDLTPYLYCDGGIPISLFKDFQKVLDKYLQYKGTIPYADWLKGFEFIPKYIKNEKTSEKSRLPQLTTLTQLQRIMFFAVCKYFKEDEESEPDYTSLKRWMRVVCNLISGMDEVGYEIRLVDRVRIAIEHISVLDSHNVYESLCNQDYRGNTAFVRRCKEEKYKAKQILDGDGNLRKYDGKTRKDDGNEYYIWEDIIIDAEKYAFFNGGISFLFCDDHNVPQWIDFDKKFESAKKYFKKECIGESCLKDASDDGELLQVLISRLDVGDPKKFRELLYNRHIFNNNPSSWRYYLLNDKTCAAVHHFMLGDNKIFHPEPVDEDNIGKNTQYLLSNTKLLDFIMKKMPDARIYYYNGYCHAMYPDGDSKYIVCLENKFKRNSFLAKNITTADNKIPGTKLFYGVNVHFDYRGRHFRWVMDDYVYLMENSDKYMWSFRDEKAQMDDDKYYRFYARGKSDDVIFALMDGLINQRDGNSK